MTEQDRLRFHNGRAWFRQHGGKGIAMDDVLAEFDHKPEDFRALLDVMEHKISGKSLDASFYENPYPGMGPAFDWKCPI